MPQEDVIAARYARGLAEAAAADGSMDEVRGDLRLLAEICAGRDAAAASPGFLDFLASPTIPSEEKYRVVDAVLDRCGVGKAVGGLLKTLVRRRRVRLVPAVGAAFAEAADALTGERTATVRTAMPLTEDQERRLAEALSAQTGTKVWLRQIVEPGLLAGAIVSIGERSFDGTVRGKIDRLGRELAGRAFAGAADNGGEKDEGRTHSS